MWKLLRECKPQAGYRAQTVRLRAARHVLARPWGGSCVVFKDKPLVSLMTSGSSTRIPSTRLDKQSRRRAAECNGTRDDAGSTRRTVPGRRFTAFTSRVTCSAPCSSSSLVMASPNKHIGPFWTLFWCPGGSVGRVLGTGRPADGRGGNGRADPRNNRARSGLPGSGAETLRPARGAKSTRIGNESRF